MSNPAETRMNSGRNARGDRGQDIPEDAKILPVRLAGGEGHIDGIAPARSLAGLFPVAASGVVGIGVGRKEENIVPGVEGVLGAVAVMDVPVDDQDPTEPAGADEVLGRDGDVVEQAESHGPVALGVMAGRPDQGEGVADLAVQDIVGGFDRSSGGEPGGLIGEGGHGRVGVELDVRPAVRPGQEIDVSRSVDRGELFVRRRPGLDPRQGKGRPAASIVRGRLRAARGPRYAPAPEVVEEPGIVDDPAALS